MLGPLEVMSGGRQVPLGGTKQRATLGYLLLQANQVVPTSRLLSVLWQADNTPVTARKILQNAVWGLRGILAEGGPDGDGGAAELVTRAPGYLIRTDPDQIDLNVFRRRVGEGRAELAGGRPEAAVASLGAALGLWRGPALADLAETGIMWPELTAVQNARLDVLEDYFEAKLACGQHYEVLGELEAAVEAEPLRERSSGQLMLALYRCGRQAHALAVYNRLRATLVEDLGLEPGHELRGLQRAILAHDPSLGLAAPRPAAAPAQPTVLAPVPAAEQPCERGDRRRTLTAVSSHRRHAHVPEQAPSRAAGSPQRAVVRPDVIQRRSLTVLLLQTRVTPGPVVPPFGTWGGVGAAAGGPALDLDEVVDLDETLERVSATARARIEHFGGRVVGSIGPFSLGLFQHEEDGGDGTGRVGDAALRALRAAAAVRDAVAPPGRTAGHRSPAERGLTLHAAVATGQALVRFAPGDPGTPQSVNGTLLDLCQRLLTLAAPGEIIACEAARLAAGPEVSYGPADGSPRVWRVREVYARPGSAAAGAAYSAPFARPPRRIGA
ncbi:AfsR/SARP family transcriptional regulator [Streptomyces sp. BPTC-684]|uniref:AfsR/SARP family transcriptional regulator n=1 Tax=Streptomyces sp. BPTC-684 TaxID=3043734 RepID=UPI0024B079B9|nr:AfsR/SARP family transcriptional regulator [Streptomyces sp. BPTC-684]WHM38833.1 AfsR/SARP family transcriptional regulator [Streptomyces sp. BPTC-684]